MPKKPKKNMRTVRVVFYITPEAASEAEKAMKQPGGIVQFNGLNDFARYSFSLGVRRHNELVKEATK